ncbi:DNA cytosine methyltransferase [Neotabrizicola sp. VNH66]|uniref:DNA cytosine methyltransferase n=1 Tax=Neotabrizicola sp. VNH66 TaxID=3400918 RepID=UPI003BFD21D2
MVLPPRNGLSLCAGGGGLDLGVQLAEPDFHTRCFVEWDEYPRSVLIAAQRAGYFAPAPIWDDLTSFDATPLAGTIDTLLAGYPCQPFSSAGKREGENDERHLWPEVARVARELGQHLRFIFLENVSGHVSLGGETVLRTLWDMGFTPAAGLFTAAETSAPHERERLFILAYRQGDDRGRELESGSPRGGLPGPSGSGPKLGNTSGPRCEPEGIGTGGNSGGGQPLSGLGSGDMDHAKRLGQQPGRHRDNRGHVGVVAHPEGGAMADEMRVSGGRHPEAGGGLADSDRNRFRPGCVHGGKGDERPEGKGRTDHDPDVSRRCCQELAHPGGAGPQGREQPRPSDERDGPPAHGPTAERGRPWIHPPRPDDAAAWAFTLSTARDLAPAASVRDLYLWARDLEAMGGQRWQEALEPAFRGMADGLAARSRALRLLGNGVHPLVAGYAWRTLAAAHGLGRMDLEAAGQGAGGRAAEPIWRMR